LFHPITTLFAYYKKNVIISLASGSTFLDTEIASIENKLAKARQIKQGMMQE